MNDVAALVMFGLICLLVLVAFVRMQRRERWTLVRGMLAIVGVSFPVRRVSTVSMPDAPAEPDQTTITPSAALPFVMSHPQRRAIRLRQLAGVRRSYSAIKLENQKLKTENQRLRQSLAEATSGQRKGVRIYLDKSAAKKGLTRSDVTLLLGKDKTAGLQVIGEIAAEIEQERRLATPLPPELAQMEPLPR